MSNENFFNSLNALNANYASNNSRSAKYDYKALKIVSDEQKKSFRVQLRKSVKSIYANIEDVSIKDLKEFAKLQEQCLLICTQSKKTFKQLTVNEVYPDFNKQKETDKKHLQSVHKIILEKIK